MSDLVGNLEDWFSSAPAHVWANKNLLVGSENGHLKRGAVLLRLESIISILLSHS